MSCTLDGLALVDVAVARLTILCPVQLAAGAPPALVVVTTTVWDAPGASVPKLQFSVCVVMLQSLPGPGVTLVRPQVRPPVVGRGSLSVTLVASKFPVFVTLIVKESC